MTETDVASDTSTPASPKRKTLLTRLAIIVAIGAILWGGWYYFSQAGFVKTDNAYVNAETAQVTPLVAGAVRTVAAIDTQKVGKGDILVVLDDADAQVDVATAEAALRQARQRFAQARATGGALGAQVTASVADISQAQGKLAAAQADFERARQAMARRDALAGTGAVSGEDASNARAQLATARASLEQARAGVAAATANRQAAIGQLAVNKVITMGNNPDVDPDVAAAKARLDAARLGLARTVVRAPVAGIVTQRQVQVGQRVAPGTPVMQIVPVDAAYVDANLKEAQLRRVRLGQPVELTSDLYGGDVVFHGRVIGLGGGTGAAFSLIPAQNATGNWVKVVQRLPVRIAIAPADLAAHPLRVGLSMEAIIDTRSK